MIPRIIAHNHCFSIFLILNHHKNWLSDETRFGKTILNSNNYVGPCHNSYHKRQQDSWQPIGAIGWNPKGQTFSLINIQRDKWASVKGVKRENRVTKCMRSYRKEKLVSFLSIWMINRQLSHRQMVASAREEALKTQVWHPVHSPVIKYNRFMEN